MPSRYYVFACPSHNKIKSELVPDEHSDSFDTKVNEVWIDLDEDGETSFNVFVYALDAEEVARLGDRLIRAELFKNFYRDAVHVFNKETRALFEKHFFTKIPTNLKGKFTWN